MGSYIWHIQGQNSGTERTMFQIAKKTPLSITAKAMYYDNKGQVNVSAQRSFLKATEINSFFFFFPKNSFKASNNEGNRGQGGEKKIFIEYSLTGA